MPGLLIQTSPCKLDRITYSKMPSTSTSTRSSASPSPSPSPRPTIHSRRTLSYTLRRSGPQSPPPPISGLGLGISNIGLTIPTPEKVVRVEVKEIEIEVEVEKEVEFGIPDREESDKECWSRMLKLQREFHCYNSARLEAAVEALEMGWGEDAVQRPSRLCLDLLNEQLRERMRVWSEL